MPMQLIYSRCLTGLLLLAALAVRTVAAQLSGSSANLTTASQINLTAEGTADWVHWGQDNSQTLNRKAGVGPQISGLELLQGNEFAYVSIFKYTNNPSRISWSDGTPTAAVANTTNGIWVYAEFQRLNTGIKFSVPADTRTRTLKVYLGVDSGQGTLTATLSDGSAGPYTSSFSDTTFSNRVYTLTYAANAPNQRLDVQWVMTTAMGSGLNTPFPNVHIQAVALAAPGISVLPLVTLTSITNGQSFVSDQPITVAANASDLDGSVSQVSFYANGDLIGTDATSPFWFDWPGATPGRHIITARATDNTGETSTSTPVEVYVHSNQSVLQGALTVLTPGSLMDTRDLTTEGTLDWAHWGLQKVDDLNRRIAGGSIIGTLSHPSTNQLTVLNDGYYMWAWNDGTPTLDGYYSVTGLQIKGTTNGFQLELASSPEGRRARIYLGNYGSRAIVRAWFTNHSGPLQFAPYAPVDIYTTYDGVLELAYASPTPDSLVITCEGDKLYDIIAGGMRFMAVTVQADNTVSLPLVLKNPRQLIEGCTFDLATQPGCTYTVEGTATLPATVWTSLTNFPGTGNIVSLTNAPFPNGQGYFRVRAQ